MLCITAVMYNSRDQQRIEGAGGIQTLLVFTTAVTAVIEISKG